MVNIMNRKFENPIYLYILTIANIETRLFLFIHALCKCRIEINQNKPNTFDNLVVYAEKGREDVFVCVRLVY